MRLFQRQRQIVKTAGFDTAIQLSIGTAKICNLAARTRTYSILKNKKGLYQQSQKLFSKFLKTQPKYQQIYCAALNPFVIFI